MKSVDAPFKSIIDTKKQILKHLAIFENSKIAKLTNKYKSSPTHEKFANEIARRDHENKIK